MTVRPEFIPIELNRWPMAQSFHYYTQIAPTTYTINVSMEVTILRKTLKGKGYKFFPAYLYLVTHTIGKQKELRIAMQEGKLGYWSNLTPAYPQFHDDDKTTSLLWTEYNEDFKVFYKHYMQDTTLYGDSHGILSAKGIPLPNAFIISCIPWFTFNSFSLHNHRIKDHYFPSFEAGGFIEKDDKIFMPLSITVHHATTDGYHIKVFNEELQRMMNHPEEWL